MSWRIFLKLRIRMRKIMQMQDKNAIRILSAWAHHNACVRENFQSDASVDALNTTFAYIRERRRAAFLRGGRYWMFCLLFENWIMPPWVPALNPVPYCLSITHRCRIQCGHCVDRNFDSLCRSMTCVSLVVCRAVRME